MIGWAERREARTVAGELKPLLQTAVDAAVEMMAPIALPTALPTASRTATFVSHVGFIWPDQRQFNLSRGAGVACSILLRNLESSVPIPAIIFNHARIPLKTRTRRCVLVVVLLIVMSRRCGMAPSLLSCHNLGVREVKRIFLRKQRENGNAIIVFVESLRALHATQTQCAVVVALP
jgi:hypothetical protein